MKKILAFFAAAVCAMAAMATNYDGQLTVTVNGDGSMMAANITVEKTAAGYDLYVKNFKLKAGDATMPVGTIELKGCEGSEAYGITTINYNKSVAIVAGDDPTVAQGDWIGPILGEVPIVMTAKLNDQVLSVNIDIDMKSTLGQVINVGFVGNAPLPAKGDINADGAVNATDVTSLINMVLE